VPFTSSQTILSAFITEKRQTYSKEQPSTAISELIFILRGLKYDGMFTGAMHFLQDTACNILQTQFIISTEL
jgi:hypothetical protein